MENKTRESTAAAISAAISAGIMSFVFKDYWLISQEFYIRLFTALIFVMFLSIILSNILKKLLPK